MLEIKNTVIVVAFVFLKHNGLCERLADSNYCNRGESMPCTIFRICVTLFVCTLLARS